MGLRVMDDCSLYLGFIEKEAVYVVQKKAMTHSLPSVRAQLALDWMCGIIDSKIYCLIVYCFFCFG